MYEANDPFYGVAYEITEKYRGNHFKVGDTVIHKKTGRLVTIIGGQYYGSFGLSNHSNWVPLSPDGPSGPWRGPVECGYGMELVEMTKEAK